MESVDRFLKTPARTKTSTLRRDRPLPANPRRNWPNLVHPTGWPEHGCLLRKHFHVLGGPMRPYLRTDRPISRSPIIRLQRNHRLTIFQRKHDTRGVAMVGNLTNGSLNRRFSRRLRGCEQDLLRPDGECYIRAV